MKSRFWVLACLLLVLGACGTSRGVVLDPDTNQVVTPAEVAEQLADHDVVFLGELHGMAPGHRTHLEIIQELHKHRPQMALSFEQIERPAQKALDAFLADEGTEEALFAAMGKQKWRNYERDYRPMVMFAKDNDLPVIAANIHRPLANKVFKEGLGAAQGDPMMAAEVWTPKEGDYYDRFQEWGGHGSSAEDLWKMYVAQCAKDDTMAESIAKFVSADRQGGGNTLVVHVNGRFHSDGHLGTVERLKRRHQDLELAVLSMEQTGGALAEWRGKADGDFVVVVPGKDEEVDVPKAQKPKADPHNPHAKSPHNPHAGSGKATSRPSGEPVIDPTARPGLNFHPAYESEAEGAEVGQVSEGGAAEKAGLKAGDVIVEMGKIPVKNFSDYMEVLGSLTPGEKIDIVIVRDGKEKTVKVTVGMSRR